MGHRITHSWKAAKMDEGLKSTSLSTLHRRALLWRYRIVNPTRTGVPTNSLHGMLIVLARIGHRYFVRLMWSRSHLIFYKVPYTFSTSLLTSCGKLKTTSRDLPITISQNHRFYLY